MRLAVNHSRDDIRVLEAGVDLILDVVDDQPHFLLEFVVFPLELVALFFVLLDYVFFIRLQLAYAVLQLIDFVC